VANISPDESLGNVIVEGICGDINWLIKSGRARGTLILIYAGIDAMAWLDRAEGQEDVKGSDFINWANEFIKFGNGNISGCELYSARNAILHSYGSESRLTRQGKARVVAHITFNEADVIESNENPDMVLLSVSGLKDAFFNGITLFFRDLQSDSERNKKVAPRIQQMLHDFRVT
jgi:hypothetical protein